MGQETNIANIDVERGLAQFAHGVAQDVHPGPIAPLAQGVVDVVYLVVDRYVRSVGDKLIMLDGQLAGLAQVAINMKKRVDRLQVFRLTHLPRVDNPVLLEVESGADASRRTVAFGSIIIVKRLEGAGLHAHHMQQVVVEDLAVDARHHRRRILSTLVLGQHLRLRHGHRKPLFALGLALVLAVGSLLIELSEHGGIHRLHGRVLGRIDILLDPLNLHLSRVGGNLCLHSGFPQLGLEHLSVVGARLGLVDDFVEPFHLGAGQVFRTRLHHFLPQYRVCLRHDHDRHEHDYDDANYLFHIFPIIVHLQR